MEISSNTKDIFIQLYEQNKNSLSVGSPAIIKDLRSAAMEYFSSHGFPDKKDERYKYTFLENYFSNGYKKEFAPKKLNINLKEIFNCDIPELNTHLILMVNGFYYNSTSSFQLEKGIKICSLNDAFRVYPEIIEKYYSRSLTYDDSYIALNSALFTDGYFIYVPKGVVMEKPIQVINILISDEDIMVQHRSLIVLEEGSQAKIVICDHTLSPAKFLTNSLLEVYTDESAILDLVRVQNEHDESVQLTHSFINQEKSSKTNTGFITLHGGMVRNNLKVTMNGEHADNSSFGLFITDNSQHVDNYTYINHVKPNCTSNQFYKGLLNDNSTASFNGRIVVGKGAQKTMAYQKSSTLLMSDHARMNTRPQLEIYADDVKCGHGATVGQLSEESMFYLQSRGIPEKEAKLLLTHAFAYEVIDKIKVDPLKDRIDELVNKRLRGELSRCNNCMIHCC